MKNYESAVPCICYIAKYYGIDVSITSLKDKISKKMKYLERVLSDEGLNIKKLNLKNKLQERLIFPLIAEVHNNNEEKTHCCILGKKNNNLFIIDDVGEYTITIEDFEKDFTGVAYLVTPKTDFSKNIGTINDVFKFVKLLKYEKKTISKIFFGSLMLCLFGIITAFYFRFLIDEVFSGGLIKMLTVFSLAYFVVISFQTILTFSRNQLLNFLGHKLDAKIITSYFNHVLKLPITFFSRFKTGEIISRMYDANVIRNIISNTFISVAIDAVMLIFGGIVLALFASKLMIISIITVLLGTIITKLFIKPYRLKMKERARAEAEKQSLLVECLNGIESIKGIAATSHAFEKAEEKIIRAAKKSLNIRTMANFQNTIQHFIQQCGNMCIYLIGGRAIINGSMSLGQLISYVILSQYFVGPLFRFLTLQPNLQEAETAAYRLLEVFNEKSEEENGTKIYDGKIFGNIELKDVSFSYRIKNTPTLQDINMCIKPGEKIAFVGESGSGKSTVAKLLMKFQNINSGEILIDGKNIDDYDLQFLRTKIGYVPQESVLFSGTIAENISFGSDEEDTSEILKSSIESKADDFIKYLPDRYDTYVGERGSTLSGGERQRISIARALLKKSDVFIFDESTSALDSILEDSVMDTIYNNLKEKTVIMISHKLSTIKDFDRIYVFDSGKIIEEGTHQELLNNKNKYYELWHTQTKEKRYEKIA